MNRPKANGLALLTALALITPATASAKRIKVKIGTVAPKGSPWFDALKQIGKRWKKASNGDIKLKIYAGGVAGDEGDMLRKMRIGQLHMGSLTGVSLAQISRNLA